MQIVAGKNCFHGAEIGPGADERLVRALAEQELQRANDDRFARAGFARDGDKARRHLPFEIFHEGEVFYPQQSKDGGHGEG